MEHLVERLKVVRETTQYHETLNPALWDQLTLKPDIRAALVKIAKHFTSKLFEKNPELLKGGVLISDIILTGSNANYNWTKFSDFDVHVVADFIDLSNPNRIELIKTMFDLQRRLWNKTHEVTVHGFPVELYFQDNSETHISSGVYSLKDNEWRLVPQKNHPTYHTALIEEKVRVFRHLIDTARSEDELRTVYDKIVQLRKSGLETAGEFSTENLAFKALRNSGHIGKVIERLQQLEDNTLTVS